MTQQSSSELTADDMEAVMKSIENEPAVSTPVSNMVPTAKPANPIKTFVSADQLKVDVAIDAENLDAACVSHAGMFVHYAYLRAQARQQYEKMKAAFEVLESRLYAETRVKLAEDGKKVTEAQVDAAVKAHPKWWAGKNRLIETQGIYDLAQAAAAAFEQRRDMIIQIGSDRRVERQGQLRLNEVAAGRENVLKAIQGANDGRKVS